ncbi:MULTISPECIES: lysine N(6)-hydroxylase/L-ornithine N(5)-oxygenase family protein [unclassified Pseudofrankia]|uniref:lysine N(6)-hydroxylase/L-ornithine N(5)-oxygenase family protein n=1 Tax=unclassified Pseudofrankia TaxID=2994372 RepID=UPI0008D95F2E|nr:MULTISPECIES: SidA/IucD/PvdA family monooxygenase [unclassified Pseudofrankia]MDT3439073.1 SidA/IucD/PvdA family monooxygenase [Pseudofrankia sp. BMG5.37]OHV45786.1 L-lysine 6-monooxygenase [Pseudofrankia sp. BMG5.36]
MVGRPHPAAPQSTQTTASELYDVIGVGFGPANLALAIAIEEHNTRVDERDRRRAVFLECQERFGWHRGMLIEGATMQVSYLKDLVTLRNPTSDFSFLAYLHGLGRLVDFINHKTMFPLRHEFHDYLEWAAGRLDHLVQYGQTVTTLRPVVEDGEITHVDVVSQDGDGHTVVRRARDVVVALGLEPRLPAGVALDDRVWHNRDLLDRLGNLPPLRHGRFMVIGAGQSGAEVTDHLHRTFPSAEVHAVFARYGYSPADNSPFANQIFDPDAVDDFFEASPDVRRMLTDYHRSTNYSVVDMDLIEDLYRRVYQEKVRGPRRLHLLRASRLAELERLDDGVRAIVEFLPTGERRDLDVDVVVFATGYRPREPRALLGEAAEAYRVDDAGRPLFTRDYRLVTAGPATAAVYITGATEHTHGISSTLLSNVAVRAGEILASILTRADSPATADDALAGDHRLVSALR